MRSWKMDYNDTEIWRLGQDLAGGEGYGKGRAALL